MGGQAVSCQLLADVELQTYWLAEIFAVCTFMILWVIFLWAIYCKINNQKHTHMLLEGNFTHVQLYD